MAVLFAFLLAAAVFGAGIHDPAASLQPKELSSVPSGVSLWSEGKSPETLGFVKRVIPSNFLVEGTITVTEPTWFVGLGSTRSVVRPSPSAKRDFARFITGRAPVILQNLDVSGFATGQSKSAGEYGGAVIMDTKKKEATNVHLDLEGFPSLDSNGLTVIGCKFSDNTAFAGAALYVSAANLIIVDSEFDNNVVTDHGGAIVANRNTNVHMFQSSFTRNLARFGGGVELFYSSIHAKRCTFQDNVAIGGRGNNYPLPNEGGAALRLYGGCPADAVGCKCPCHEAVDDATYDGSLLIEESTFHNNSVQLHWPSLQSN